MALRGLFDTARGVGQDIVGGAQDYIQGLSNVEQQFQSGDRNLGEYVVGTGYYGVARPVEQLFSYFIPDPIEEALGSAVQAGMEYTGLDEQYAKLDEDTRRFIEESTGLAGVLTPSGMLKGQLESRKRSKGGPDTRTDREAARSGMISSNFDVIIDNFYDPNTKTYPGLRGDTQFDKIGRKLAGLGEWGAKGIARTAKLAFNPVARARYMEYGVAPVATEAYKKLAKTEEKINKMPDGPEKTELQKELNRSFETVTSQLQQMANIGAQAGSQPLRRNVPREFAERASMEGTPLYATKKELGKNWFENVAGDLGNVGPVTTQNSKFIQDHIENAWKGSGLDMGKAKILVKQPTGRLTGDHWASLAYNSQVNAIERAFRPTSGRSVYEGGEIVTKQSGPDTWRTGDPEPNVAEKRVLGGRTKKSTAPAGGFSTVSIGKDGAITVKPDVDALRQRLEETRVSEVDGKLSGDESLVKTFAQDSPKNFKIEGQDDRGVWVSFSHPSRAKVEGGMNVLLHVDVDGTLTSVASDLHDFGDKIPVVNKLLEDALPNQVVAVTPPMQTNVQSLSSLRAGDKDNLRAEYNTVVDDQLIDPPKARFSEAELKNELEVLDQLSPSTREVARQLLPVAGNVNFSANVFAPDEEDPLAPTIR